MTATISLNVKPCPASGEGAQPVSAMTVSCVKTAKDTTTQHYDAREIIESIRTEKYFKLREPVEKIRQRFGSVIVSTGGDRKAAKGAVAEAKKRLPAVLWSGRFRNRKRNDPDKLSQHSGLLCADLDEVGERVAEVRASLVKSPHLWALFVSPTGDGLKCVFRVPADAERHKASFREVERHVRDLTGVQIDESCSDVSRLCFLSHDPNAYLNGDAIELPPLSETEKSTSAKTTVAQPEIEKSREIMKFFTLQNLSSKDAAQCDPTTAKPVPSYPATKEKFRVWCKDKKTKHCFYSPVEGITPSLRVTRENPAHLMHGLVVDYDSKITDDMVKLIPKNGAAGLLPTWISTTYSGNRRLVFEFEEPVPANNEELSDRFLRLLAKELKLNKLLPGLDENSFKQTQYFELGRDWISIPGGSPIPSDQLEYLFYKAAAAKPIKADGPLIPIKAVADEFEKRWPGKWPGEFAPGARGPLVWLEDGIDRVGCMVGDYGIICFSDRGGKPFLPWSEILGHKFVRDFEAARIGKAMKGLSYNRLDRRFVKKDPGGVWWEMNTEECARELKDRGLSSRVTKGTISEVDQVMAIAARERGIYGCFPFVHNPNDIVTLRGRKYLNTSLVSAIAPAESGDPAHFPWLYEFVHNVWDPAFPEQMEYFLAWFKRFYVGCLDRKLDSGHAVFIAGDVGIGKTLWSHRVVGDSVGGSAEASKYFLKETSFNEELSAVALWTVDDAIGAPSWEKHAQFSAAIKRFVASDEIRSEAKYKNSITVPANGRALITCNTSPQALTIIPELDNTINEKLMLFKFGKWRPRYGSKAENNARIASELPHFLKWVSVRDVPKELESDTNVRFGLRHFHHPDLARAAKKSCRETALMELLEIWRQKIINDEKAESKWFTAAGLRGNMELVQEVRGQLRPFSAVMLGRTLSNLHEQKTGDVIEIKEGERESTKYLIKL
jgi:hypothetical protein